MSEIELSEEYVRDALRRAKEYKEWFKKTGDRYKEGIYEWKIRIYKSFLTTINIR